MDEHIFDPVTYALLKSQLKTDEIQNDSEYITGEDLTEALNNLNDTINKGVAKSVQSVDSLVDFDDMSEYIPYFTGGLIKAFRVKINALNNPADQYSWGFTIVMYANAGNQFVQYFFSTSGVYRRTAPGDNTFGNWARLDDSLLS